MTDVVFYTVDLAPGVFECSICGNWVVYKRTSDKLKIHAKKHGGNAVVRENK